MVSLQDLHAESIAYQAMLETLRRADRDHRDYHELVEDVGKAKRSLELAWLRTTIKT